MTNSGNFRHHGHERGRRPGEGELDASGGAWLFRAPESRSLPTSHTGHSLPATCPSVPRETYQFFAFQGARGEEGVLSPHSSPQLGQFVVLGRRRPTKPQKAENRASEESRFPRPLPPLSRSRRCAQSDHCCGYGAARNSLEPLPPPPPHSRGSHAVSVPHHPQPAHHPLWMWPENGGRKDELRVQRGQQSLNMSG